ncbi:hypothetical protein RRF57_008019 [Xylaria bambusicola]|uniref:Uncharacterized protein n=1 Tax=Xylaria bambusicola TaxID=326684 RepID=A0AAN7UH20_9PEZI
MPTGISQHVFINIPSWGATILHVSESRTGCRGFILVILAACTRISPAIRLLLFKNVPGSVGLRRKGCGWRVSLFPVAEEEILVGICNKIPRLDIHMIRSRDAVCVCKSCSHIYTPVCLQLERQAPASLIAFLNSRPNIAAWIELLKRTAEYRLRRGGIVRAYRYPVHRWWHHIGVRWDPF